MGVLEEIHPCKCYINVTYKADIHSSFEEKLWAYRTKIRATVMMTTQTRQLLVEKTKMPLKNGEHIKIHFGPPFLKHNNLFRIYFFRMYYFQFRIFLSKMEFLFLNFISGNNNLFWIYFSIMYYFKFRIFISRIKNIFGI